jgi:hypothetical protein
MSALTDQTIPRPAIQKLAKIVGGDAASLNKLVPYFLELWRSLQPITEHKCSIGNSLPIPLHALQQFDDLVFRNEGFSILVEIIGVVVPMASSGARDRDAPAPLCVSSAAIVGERGAGARFAAPHHRPLCVCCSYILTSSKIAHCDILRLPRFRSISKRRVLALPENVWKRPSRPSRPSFSLFFRALSGDGRVCVCDDLLDGDGE